MNTIQIQEKGIFILRFSTQKGLLIKRIVVQ